MLSKLLKYEYRATARFLLPLYLGVLFVIMVNALFLRMGDFFPAFASGDSYSLILALLLIACVLGFLAVVIAGFVTGIQRFYGLLGTRGYLMFSLPVTANQLIASKLICATSWMIGAFLLGCVFLRMMAFPFGAENLVVIAPNSGVALFCHCLALLAMLCCSILFFYFCIALGGQWPQNRLIATILCYYLCFADCTVLRNDRACSHCSEYTCRCNCVVLFLQPLTLSGNKRGCLLHDLVFCRCMCYPVGTYQVLSHKKA